MPGLILGNDAQDFNQIIDRIIEFKSQRSYLIQTNLVENDSQLKAVDLLKDRFESLREASRDLYRSEDQAFRFKSDLDYLDGKVSNHASPGVHEIKILSLAQPEILASDQLENDFSLPSGKIVFKIKDEVISLRFEGGSPRQLVEEINREAEGWISANWIRKNRHKFIFILRSMRAGADHRIHLLEDSSGVLSKLGLYRQNRFDSKSLWLSSQKLAVSQADPNFESVKDQTALIIPARGKVTKSLNRAIDFNQVKKIYFDYRRMSREESLFEGYSDQEILPSGQVFFDLTLEEAGEIRKVRLKSVDSRSGKTLVLDQDTLSVRQKTLKWLTLEIINQTDTSLVIGDFFYDKRIKSEEVYSSKNVLQAGRGTKFLYQSVELERDGNQVNDLIDGVSLTLKKPSAELVKFEVLADADQILEKMIRYVGEYNETIEYLNIFTAPNLEALGVEGLKPILMSKIGSLKNEFSIKRIKNRMRNITIGSYFIDYEIGTVFLSQIGIKNNYNFSQPYYIDANKISFDEDLFREAMIARRKEVKLLFSYDSDQDSVIDNGFAWKIDQFLTENLGINSFMGAYALARRSEKKRLEERLEREQVRIEEEREKMEIDFSKIEQVKKQQEQFQSWFQNFGKK